MVASSSSRSRHSSACIASARTTTPSPACSSMIDSWSPAAMMVASSCGIGHLANLFESWQTHAKPSGGSHSARISVSFYASEAGRLSWTFVHSLPAQTSYRYVGSVVIVASIIVQSIHTALPNNISHYSGGYLCLTNVENNRWYPANSYRMRSVRV